MVVQAYFEPGLITMEPGGMLGGSLWTYGGQQFHWDGKVLWASTPAGFVPLARFTEEMHAVQFSLGFWCGTNWRKVLTARDMPK